MMNIVAQRRGTTLIELLFFVAIMGMISAVAIPMLFSATENRMLQQTISIVEHNGTQVLKTVVTNIHQSERILSPAIGQTGSVLVLQSGVNADDPTILGMMSGRVILIQNNVREIVTSPQVAVVDFKVRNTSTSATRQSAEVTFRISRTIRLQSPHSYAQSFIGGAVLFPDDVLTGWSAACAPAPVCLGNNIYQWSLYRDESCHTATTQIRCP